MPWLQLSDDHSDDTRILTVGPLAAWLHTCALVYCAKAMTDGFIPTGQLRRLADLDNAPALAEVLVRVGLWQPAVGGWMVPDYLGKHGNNSRAQIEEYREKKRTEIANRRRGRKQLQVNAPPKLPANVFPGTSVERSTAVPPPAPAPAPAPTPVNQPLPLPPLPLSSSTAHGPLHPDCEDVNLLLLDDLVSFFEISDEDGGYGRFGRDAYELARRSGVEPDDPAVPLADLVYTLMRSGIGMERGTARRMVLAQPREVADWLANPDRWERARNPAGLLRARLDPDMQTRKEHHG